MFDYLSINDQVLPYVYTILNIYIILVFLNLSASYLLCISATLLFFNSFNLIIFLIYIIPKFDTAK
jgi:hypothetical protein